MRGLSAASVLLNPPGHPQDIRRARDTVICTAENRCDWQRYTG